ncbi:MAG: ABC transporter permease [Tuberibacillus sp.]
MKELLWLTMNTLKIQYKKKFGFFVMVGLPIVGIMIAFFSWSGSSSAAIRVGIVNKDTNQISSDASAFISSMNHVKVRDIKEKDVNDLVASGALDCVIIFEQGFSDSVRSGKPEQVVMTSIKGASITGYIKSYLNFYIGNIASLGRIAGNDQAKFNQLYNNYKQADFKVDAQSLQDTSKNAGMTYQTVGYLVMFMLFSAVNLSMMITKEKERRTYFRVLSAPVSAKTFVLSNVITNMLIMTFQVIVTMVVMTKGFHIQIGFPFWEMFVILILFSFIAVGLSLVIVAYSGSTAAAGALQNLIVTPSCLLSGCFFPVDIMPSVVRKIADFMPQRWLLDTITKLQDGQVFTHLYINYLILIAFATAFFLLAVYKFGRGNDVRNFI